MSKNNSENKRYTNEYKESVLKRLEAPAKETIKSYQMNYKYQGLQFISGKTQQTKEAIILMLNLNPL